MSQFKVETCCDSVKVYDGPSMDPDLLLADLSGMELPDPIVSSSNELTIQFNSDFTNGFAGFHLVYNDGKKLLPAKYLQYLTM